MQPRNKKLFTSWMVSQEIHVLRHLHGMLENDRIARREDFTDLMVAAFHHGKLEPRALADDLAHSISAVYRWIEGSSAPHPSLWPTIVQWIMSAIKKRIDEIEECGVDDVTVPTAI